jgi:hypothetical protein
MESCTHDRGTGVSAALMRTRRRSTEWQSTGGSFTPNTMVGSVGPDWTLDSKPTTHAHT